MSLITRHCWRHWRADFDHTKSLADRFRRPEARLMARFLIAQSILSDHLNADQQPGVTGITGGAFLMAN